MSDPIKHECGIAFIRLLKPLDYYLEKYQNPFYGTDKLYLLMEKQHNRGQDGAGIAIQKLDKGKDSSFLYRDRKAGNRALSKIFKKLNSHLKYITDQYSDALSQPSFLKGHLPFYGEVLLGHLRYGTQGQNDVKFCHPFLKASTDPNKNLTMAGNFNLANTQELLSMVDEVNTTIMDSDLSAMVSIISQILNNEVEKVADVDLFSVLKKAYSTFDGGYLTCGLIGNGDSFIVRDAHGIRPGYYYHDDEVFVSASERAAIMTSLGAPAEQVKEVPPGHAIVIKKNGEVEIERILEEKPIVACSFERIYFSRGSDAEIYKERKQLGKNIAEKVLDKIEYNLKDTLFSYIPNTAETAFFGLIKGAEKYLNKTKVKRIDEIVQRGGTSTEIEEIINRRVRVEKIPIKDVKMRTFITQDTDRDEMVQHVYDITYGTVRENHDTLVVIDDSIVRGTTLKESIIRMLDRLKPKKIIVVSSAPQIRFPDCYGIDMSKLSSFIAFRAALELLKDRGNEKKIEEVYKICKKAKEENEHHKENFVKKIYEDFSADEISVKIAEMLKRDDVDAEVEIIYQSLEGLRDAVPYNRGDWYFTGNYPTPGGNRTVNSSFINFYEGKDKRGY